MTQVGFPRRADGRNSENDNILAVTDAEGNVQQQVLNSAAVDQVMAQGNFASLTTLGAGTIGVSGVQYYDADTGLSYSKGRWFDADTGRSVSQQSTAVGTFGANAAYSADGSGNRGRVPECPAGRLPHQSFRGLIERSLALRPASSRDHQVILSIEGSDEFVASSAASIATGQATLPRRDFHPLEYTRIHGARTSLILEEQKVGNE